MSDLEMDAEVDFRNGFSQTRAEETRTDRDSEMNLGRRIKRTDSTASTLPAVFSHLRIGESTGAEHNASERLLDNRDIRMRFAENTPGEMGTQRLEEDRMPVNIGRMNQKPPTFNGQMPWEEYLVQFKIVARINRWNEASKGFYLAANLKGSAVSVLMDLGEEKCTNYKMLVDALETHYGYRHMTPMFRSQFRSLVQGRNEAFPALAMRVRRLARLAHPEAGRILQDVLARDQFMDVIVDEDVRWKVLQSQPKTLDDALGVALETDALFACERQRNTKYARMMAWGRVNGSLREGISFKEECDNSHSELKEIKDILCRMQECLMKSNVSTGPENFAGCKYEPNQTGSSRHGNNHSSNMTKWSKDIICYGCGMKGHIKQNCWKERKEGFHATTPFSSSWKDTDQHGAGNKGILGCNFLRSHTCAINVGENKLTLNGGQTEREHESFMECHQVKQQDNVPVPPLTGVIAKGLIAVGEETLCKDVFGEPMASVHNKDRAYCTSEVEVLKLPMEKETCGIYMASMKKHDPEGDEKRNCIQEMHDRTSDGLSTEQLGYVNNVVHQIEDVCSAGSHELGRQSNRKQWDPGIGVYQSVKDYQNMTMDMEFDLVSTLRTNLIL